jgi:hypothetical protein
VPVPDAVAEHDPNEPSAPPAGTVIVKVMVVPETVPDTVPVALVPDPVSVRFIAPENDEPDWLRDHDMSPDPDESVAVPDQAPLTSAGEVDGGDGEGVEGEGDVVVERPPPLHPAAISPAIRRTAQPVRPTSGMRVMVKKRRRILARLTSVDWKRI